MRFNRALVVLLLFCGPLLLMSQKKKNTKKILKNAITFFEAEDYASTYKLLKEIDSDANLTTDAKYMLGVCKIKLNEDHTESINLLEDVKINSPAKKFPNKLYLFLGDAYHFNYDFNNSIKNYTLYKQFITDNIEEQQKTERKITISKYAEKKYANIEDYEIVNLGPEINSTKADYAPVISADETTLIFTSRRAGGMSSELDFDGEHFEDIYISEKDGLNKWKPVELFGNGINTEGHEATCSITADGQKLYLYRSGTSGKEGMILESRLNGSEWMPPVALGKNINSKSWVSSVSVTSDEQVLYFTSNKKGGYGGKDIYLSRKMDDGSWGVPENLGPEVNTEFDEESPYIHPDGRTLFFSSKGHQTMGGYDVFKTIFNDSVWSAPENLGYPLNTTKDDLHFVLAANGKNGYYSSNSKDSYGKQDIYKIVLPKSNIPLTMIRGNILCADSLKPLDVVIKLKDLATGEFIKHIYKPNPETGKYLIIVPPGKNYDLIITSKGYIPYKMNVYIPEQKEFYELYQTIYIKAVKPFGKQIGQGISVDNSFFNKAGVLTDLDEQRKKELIRQQQLQQLINNIINKSDSISMNNLEDVVESNFDVSYKTVNVDTGFGSLLNLVNQIFDNTDSTALKHVNNIIERGFYTYAEENIFFYGDSTLNLKDTITVSSNSFSLAQPIQHTDSVSFGTSEKNEVFKEENVKRNKENQILTKTILFGTAETIVRDIYEEVLNELIELSKNHSKTFFILTGHTDDVGDKDYNRNLSKSRVESVAKYILSRGVQIERISKKWEGEENPLNNNGNESKRAANRRVEIRVIEKF